MSSTAGSEKGRANSQPEKIHEGKEETCYIGFQVESSKMRLLLDKIEALWRYQAPQTKKQMKAFLGLANYYRKFVPRFAEFMVPLREPPQIGAPTKVMRTPKAERAFQEVKEALCLHPLLYMPDFDKTFTAKTDASNTDIGTVLMQETGDEEHPVAYISRKLHPS